jgi:hypothetical protein
MVRLFLNYLQAVGVEEARLRYQVHVHESADVAVAVSFWAQVVGVDTDRFQPPVLKRDRLRTNRHNVGASYHGCLSVRVTGAAELYRRIEGTWWAVRAAAKATSSVRENARITRPEVDPISGLPLRLARVRRILRRGRRAWASA